MRKNLVLLAVIFFISPLSAWAFTNDQLADQALTHVVGSYGNTCKIFVQNIVEEVDGELGQGYRDAYLEIGVEISPDQVKRGDVGQTCYDPDPTRTDDDAGKGRVHSFIVLENNGYDDYRVIHSNWCDPSCNLVSITNNLHPEAWVQNGGAGWNIHFYRLGDDSNNGVGYSVDGTFSQAIYDCWVRYGSDGYPIDDNGGGTEVHRWLPWRYFVQNFRKSNGEEYAIMYDPLRGGQAYVISGNFWEFFRHGRDGRYGPDIPLSNGKTLGIPTTDAVHGIQYFENGYYVSGSVELYQMDGTLVEVFEPTGAFSAATITGEAASQNHNVIDISGGPTADEIVFLANNVEVQRSTLTTFVHAQLNPGDVNVYEGILVSHTQGELQRTNKLTIVSPGVPGEFLLQGAPDGSRAIRLELLDTQFNSQFHDIYCNQIFIARITGPSFGHQPLAYNTTYNYSAAAVTASGMILGWSNSISVTTDPAPVEPPLPPPPPTQDPVVELELISVEIVEPGPYLPGTVITIRAEFRYFGSATKEISRIQAIMECEDQWGSIYTKNFAADQYSPVLVLNPGDTFIYESTNDGWALPGMPTTNTIRFYVKFNGIAGQYQITKAVDGESAEFIFETIDPSTLKAQVEKDFLQYTPGSPTTADVVDFTIGLINKGEVEAINVPVEFMADDGQSYSTIVPSILPNEVKTLASFPLGPFASGQRSLTVDIDSGHQIDMHQDNRQSTTLIEVEEIVESLKPNLTAVITGTTPTSPTSDDSVVLSSNVTNTSFTPVNAGVLQILVDGEVFTLHFYSALAGYETFESQVTIGQLTEGSHTITVRADPNGVVDESNEGDNESRVDLVVVSPPMPDIVAISATPRKTSFFTTEQVIIDAVFQNIDDASSAACQAQLRLAQGNHIATVPLPALDVNETCSVTFTVSVSTAGDYPVVVTGDYTNTVEENNEGNNSVSTSFRVVNPPLPEWKIYDFSVEPVEPWLGENFRIVLTIGNEGGAPGLACPVGLVFDGVTYVKDVQPLGVGQTSQVVFDLGPTTSLGSFTSHVTVNYGWDLQEEDETNNEADITYTVIPPQNGESFTLYLHPVFDTVIKQDWDELCGHVEDPQAQTLNIQTRTGINRESRALLYYNLSELPPNCTIISADHSLTTRSQGEYVGNDWYTNLLVQPFDELTTTWCHATGQTPWQDEGGTYLDFGESVVYIESYYTGEWHLQSGSVDDVIIWDVKQMLQSVINGQNDNYGFIISQYPIANGSENQSISFASKEHPDPAVWPTLIVTYTMGGEETFLWETGFEDGFPENMYTGGSGSIPTFGLRSYLYGGMAPNGNQSLYIGDSTNGSYATSYVEFPFDFTGDGFQSGSLSLAIGPYSLYGSEYVAVMIYDGTWQTLVSTNKSGWQLESFDLSQFDLSGEFIIRIETYMNYSERSDAAYVDDISLALSTLPPAPITTVLNETFENGLESWQINVVGSGSVPLVRTDSSPYYLTPTSGSNVLYLGDSTSGSWATASAETTLNLSGYSQAQLTYDWAAYRLESSDYVRLDVFDGQWHQNVARLQTYYGSNIAWIPIEIDLSSYNLIDGFKIRFVSYMNYHESSDAAYIDDVVVTVQ